jgi:hypothetical protein
MAGHKIEWMRRESATVVVLIGDVDDGLLAGLVRSPNVSVARAPKGGAAAAEDDADAAKLAAVRPGWEPGALAMREAARRRSTYVIVPDDPLAAVAADWHAMWDVSNGAAGPAEFERSAAEALAAWRDKQFELPDYYIVTQAVRNTEAVRPDRAGGVAPDMYLGPLRAARPRRIAVAGVAARGVADSSVRAARVIETLRSLEHGPWWPPLDDLLDATRGFYAGGLAEIALTR